MTEADLRGKRVLIVEDEGLIALDLEDAVAAVGMLVVGGVATLADAINAAETSEVDVAILDVSLKGELIWPAADILQRRGIPLLFLTGYHESIVPARFTARPRLNKPVDVRQLLRELAAALYPAGPA